MEHLIADNNLEEARSLLVRTGLSVWMFLRKWHKFEVEHLRESDIKEKDQIIFDLMNNIQRAEQADKVRLFAALKIFRIICPTGEQADCAADWSNRTMLQWAKNSWGNVCTMMLWVMMTVTITTTNTMMKINMMIMIIMIVVVIMMMGMMEQFSNEQAKTNLELAMRLALGKEKEPKRRKQWWSYVCQIQTHPKIFWTHCTLGRNASWKGKIDNDGKQVNVKPVFTKESRSVTWSKR